MLLASVRCGLLLATFVASLHADAASRFWMLDGVQLRGELGTSGRVTGYFSYDDATQAVSSWNLRVGHFPFVSVPPFTYTPGNSTVSVIHPSGAGAPAIVVTAAIGASDQFGWPGFEAREMQIGPVTTLDGRFAAVPIDTFLSKETIPSLGRARMISAGSLTLMPVPPPVVVARVDEFYNAALRHYFITADDAEKQALDTGVHPGWARTGESFKAHAVGSGQATSPVCRYYSPPIIEFYYYDTEPGSDSHFFSADGGECVNVFRKFSSHWGFEVDDAFEIALPNKTTGACPGGTIPVYRLWNRRTDSNHRYTTSPTIKAQMIAAGHLAEGYGPDGVAMCALQ
jgi:hypothetical protein